MTTPKDPNSDFTNPLPSQDKQCFFVDDLQQHQNHENQQFHPPYQGVGTIDPSTSQAPYSISGESQALHQEAGEVHQKEWSLLRPLFFLLPGAVLFLFGLVLFLYSGQQYLTLRWNCDFWPYFLLPSFFLLFFGWRSLCHEEEGLDS